MIPNNIPEHKLLTLYAVCNLCWFIDHTVVTQDVQLS